MTKTLLSGAAKPILLICKQLARNVCLLFWGRASPK